MQKVGFEPTPFRNRALIYRLRPLGHFYLSDTSRPPSPSYRTHSLNSLLHPSQHNIEIHHRFINESNRISHMTLNMQRSSRLVMVFWIVEIGVGLLQMKIIRVQIQGEAHSDNNPRRIAISLNLKKHTTIASFILHICKLFALEEKKYQLNMQGYAISHKDRSKILREDVVYRLKEEDNLFSEEDNEDSGEDLQLREQLGRKKKDGTRRTMKGSLIQRLPHQKHQSKACENQKMINFKARSRPQRSKNPFQQLVVASQSEESDPQPRKMSKLNEQVEPKTPLKPISLPPQQKKQSIIRKRYERSNSSSSQSSLTPSIHQKPKKPNTPLKQPSEKQMSEQSQQRNSIQRFACGQISYYFSDKNYYNDQFLQMLQHHKPNFYISVACFLRFPKIKKFNLTQEQLLRYLSQDERLDQRNYILNYEEKTLRKKDLIQPEPIPRQTGEWGLQ